MPTFYAGLALLCLGNGLFKPNISAMVGNLYAPGDPRRDAGFNIFYMGINIGASLSALLSAPAAQPVELQHWPSPPPASACWSASSSWC